MRLGMLKLKEFLYLSNVGLLDVVLVLGVDVLDLHHVGVEDEVGVASLSLDLTLFHDHDVVSEMNEVNCVSGQDSGLVLHDASENLVKDTLAHMRVQS